MKTHTATASRVYLPIRITAAWLRAFLVQSARRFSLRRGLTTTPHSSSESSKYSPMKAKTCGERQNIRTSESEHQNQNIRTPEHQNIRTPEHQNTRTPEHQHIRTPEHQNIRTAHGGSVDTTQAKRGREERVGQLVRRYRPHPRVVQFLKLVLRSPREVNNPDSSKG